MKRHFAYNYIASDGRGLDAGTIIACAVIFGPFVWATLEWLFS